MTNSLQRLTNLFQKHQKRMRLIFYIFAINNNKKWIHYIQRYENNNTKNWKIKINVNLLFNQFNSFFLQFFVVIVKRFFVITFAINQNRSINKNWKHLNSKNLKQHTFAKSISFCCFCFCYCFVRKIDRFIILICKCLLRRLKSKFSTKFSFSLFSQFIFHIYRICHEIFNINNDQSNIYVSINEFFRNVDR